jgi:hypothetical protein
VDFSTICKEHNSRDARMEREAYEHNLTNRVKSSLPKSSFAKFRQVSSSQVSPRCLSVPDPVPIPPTGPSCVNGTLPVSLKSPT